MEMHNNHSNPAREEPRMEPGKDTPANQVSVVQARRKTRLDLVVGINGTGKTTFLRQEVVERSRKALVLTPDEAEWRHLPRVATAQEVYAMQGAARYVCDNPQRIDDDMALISHTFYGGSLILDDARAYIGHMTGQSTNYLYIRRRQYGVDIYLVAHALDRVPKQAFSYATYLHLFYTTGNIQYRKRDLDPDTYERILKAKEAIKRAVQGGEKYACAHIKIDQSL